MGAMDPEEARLIVDGARRLRDEVLEPAERALDAMPLSVPLYAEEAYVRALDQAHGMGVHRIAIPEPFGGLGAPAEVALATAMEVAGGAPGLASQLLFEGVLASVAARFAGAGAGAGPERLRAALDAEASAPGGLALAVLHPGADPEAAVALPGSGLRFHAGRAPAGAAASVTQDGAGLRLRSVRLPLVANGDRCAHLLLVVGPAPGGDQARTYLLPVAQTAGLRREPAAPRLGLRLHSHADVVADDVLLGQDRIVIGPADTPAFLEQVLAALNAGMAARAVGLAARAHDHALAYARTRVQGGKHIVEHRSVAEVLWRTDAAIDTVRRAMGTLAASVDGAAVDLRPALAARTAAAAMVVPAATEMTELLGGYGITTEYPLEKLYRDAQALAVAAGSVEGPGVVAGVSLS